jgi:hypothetical protein
VTVPGFTAPEPAILLAAVDSVLPQQTLPREYTLSLIEWFDEWIELEGGGQ